MGNIFTGNDHGGHRYLKQTNPSTRTASTRDGIAVAPDRLSEAYMVYQKDFKSNRKGNDKRYG